jgi:hypothetical protein
MEGNKQSTFLCRALAASIAVLITGFLGLGVRAFASADTTKFIFSVVFAISVVVFAMYFLIRRLTRELKYRSLFAPRSQRGLKLMLPLPASEAEKLAVRYQQ